MPFGNTTNPFLADLLGLQQDGSGAISAPTNWCQEPLLEVETRLGREMEDLADGIAAGDGTTGRWHFLVGSPGNGKSAATGKLCRLLEQRGFLVVDDDDCPLRELPPGRLPYLLRVRRPRDDRVIAWVVQDASVVRRPFEGVPDPARDLRETLDGAAARGISLVVCANRGVLEDLVARLEEEDANPAWAPAVVSIAGTAKSAGTTLSLEFDAHGSLFERATVSATNLDTRSLLVDEPVMERLVEKAVDGERWQPCQDCQCRSTCPFKANRDYLATKKGRESFLRILRRAEFMDAQVLVFREALALVSLLLAGCPADYGNAHPCEWVAQRLAKEDLFSLASRRIYMLLFAPWDALGFEDRVLRSRADGVRALREAARGIRPIVQAIDHARAGKGASRDVGLRRLLGPRGVMAKLDPLRWPHGAELYDEWDGDYGVLAGKDSPLLGQLERKCIECWRKVESRLEDDQGPSAAEAYWVLRRWSSNFLLHLACMHEGSSAWGDLLDRFVGLHRVASRPRSPSAEDAESLAGLEGDLESVLMAGDSVTLGETVRLRGAWVRDHLRPRVLRVKEGEETGSLGIMLSFGGTGGEGERSDLTAKIYCWVELIARGHEGFRLDPRCLPGELLADILDARRRAAIRGKYAFQDRDVELLVDGARGEEYTMRRAWGTVTVTCKGEGCDGA